MDHEIIPIVFQSSSPGALKPTLAVADVFNPDRHIVIKDFGDFVDTIRLFRKAARSVTHDQSCVESVRALPVIITYNRPLRDVYAVIMKFALGDAFLLQIGRPVLGFKKFFDFVALMPFEKSSGIDPGKALRIQILPTGVNHQTLEKAGQQWAPRIKSSKRLIAIVVGGSKKTMGGWDFTETHAEVLINFIKKATNDQDCDFVLTTSHRTPENVVNILKRDLEPLCRHSYFCPDGEANPYIGYLACADAIVVTGESVSMISDVLETGKKVYAYWPEGIQKKKHFYAGMKKLGLIEPLLSDTKICFETRYKQHNSAFIVAAQATILIKYKALFSRNSLVPMSQNERPAKIAHSKAKIGGVEVG